MLVYLDGGVVVQKELPLVDAQIPQGYYKAKIIHKELKIKKNVEFRIEMDRKHFLE
jgi:hypothetical protein